MSRCKAYQMSDQMRCDLCNFTWDINDPEPPTCGATSIPHEIAHNAAEAELDSSTEEMRRYAVIDADNNEVVPDEELRGMISGVQDGERVAASNLRRVWSRDAQPRYSETCKLFEHGGHVLYTDADPDAPLCVRDGNGQVVLALCKNCGMGEADLASVCPNPPALPSTFSERGRAIVEKIGQALDEFNDKPAGEPLWCHGVFVTGDFTLSFGFNRLPTVAEREHFLKLIQNNLPKR